MWRGSVFTFDMVIKKVLMTISSVYFALFEFILKFLKNFGVIGELLFIPFGLTWLLWPLYVAYTIGRA